MTATQVKKKAIVIGGGLAGISSALRLAQRGVSVTLVETRKRLGGRATSFVDPTTGEVLDNCQHVLLGCCTNLLELYRQLGVTQQIQWHRRLYFCNHQGQIDVLAATDLPAPTHLTHALLAFKSLTWQEKLAICSGVYAMMRLSRADRKQWHHRSFADWLKTHRQPAGAIQKYWACVAVSALNETPEQMAADYAIQVFQEGFCANEDAYAMGLSDVPLVKLYDQAHGAITQAGGEVMLATSAQRLIYDGEYIQALELANGEQLHADCFIAALPFDRLDKLCDQNLRDADSRLATLVEFTTSPILGIHLWFKSPTPVMVHPHLALTESPLHWLFNKGYDTQTQEQHLHGVISAAHDWIGLPADVIEEKILTEIRQVLPLARDASLAHCRVIKEKRATFSIKPGIDKYRPKASGSVENLFLAGDWCDSGWPATMEGAVRSGFLAAAASLQYLGLPQGKILEDDLPPSSFYKLIANVD